MSIEISVFYSGPLPSAQSVQQTMHEFDLPFKIVDLTRNIDSYGGFMPMAFDEEETGVEVYSRFARDTIEEFEEEGIDCWIDPAFEHEIWFRWSSVIMEGACAYASAAAIAKLTGGAIYDDDLKIISIETGAQAARSSLERARTEAEASEMHVARLVQILHRDRVRKKRRQE